MEPKGTWTGGGKPSGAEWLRRQLERSRRTSGRVWEINAWRWRRAYALKREFMQRGLDLETKKQLEEEEKKIISEEHWYLDLPELKEKESFIVEERSFMPCEDLLFGRMSFKGFNPDVEKLMIQMNSKYKTEEIKEEDNAMEADVSDEEMARRYETLVGTIGKKFLKKRDRHVLQDAEEDENRNTRPTKAKKMFLKAQD
ncbi:M-phase phosphoprotein 6 isoform X1 [Rhineura floridana]|uniref:M-phase phosphoprotein 6 isoform X1 n=1 Tax=Rhineura floridana TaxID=261503 RepID=UPI002AC8700A|nr:M-phase phosphoprotein 6 isoform X1 [Rhineura floridana]